MCTGVCLTYTHNSCGMDNVEGCDLCLTEFRFQTLKTRVDRVGGCSFGFDRIPFLADLNMTNIQVHISYSFVYLLGSQYPSLAISDVHCTEAMCITALFQLPLCPFLQLFPNMCVAWHSHVRKESENFLLTD